MSSLKQVSFAGGIISPQVFGRTDLAKYATGARELLNFQVPRFGTAENRAGFRWCIEVKDSSATVREVPFIFNATISYNLEFGNLYVRPLSRGARISVVGAAAYAGGTTYGIGDLVTSLGIVYYSRVAGNVGHTPASSPTQWYVQTGGLLEVPTNLAQAALSTFQYVQQNDVMTIAHQSIPPQQLQRYSDTKWVWIEFAQSTGIDAPTGVVVVAGVPAGAYPAQVMNLTAIGGLGGAQDSYVVTAWRGVLPLSEGQTSGSALSTVGKATGANPVALAWDAVAAADGYAIYKYDGVGNYGIIGISDTNAFSDNGINFALAVRVANTATLASNAITFYYVVTAIDEVSGAESLASVSASASGQDPDTVHPNVISWVAVAGASSYRVYRVVNGVPGFVGAQPASPFNDTNITPAFNIQPPVAITLFADPDDYPGVVGYYQQRLMFANSINEPQTVEASNVGVFSNFSIALPVTDDAAVQFTIAGRQVQEVRALLDLGKLVIHTSGDEYMASGNAAGNLTPSGIGLVHQSSSGCAALQPVVIGNSGLFVQSRANVVRDLEYSIYTTSFKGRDLTIFAPSLFLGATIVDMAWQQIPNSIVWCVLSNGILLGLTYIKDHEMWAWHQHDSTNGLYENVSVVPEGSEDVLYVVVKRTINGSTKRYIERMMPREFTDIQIDAFFVDSGLTYDGRNTLSTTMLATTAGGWTPQDTLTLTASVAFFTIADIGNAIRVQQVVNGTVQDEVTFDIIGYTSPTAVSVQSDQTVPAWARVALTTWGKAVHQFSGMDHLEGETITALGDGNVVPQTTVSGGAFTTQLNYVVLHAGLPITADFESLPAENTQGESIQDNKTRVIQVTPILYNSRGGFYGQDFDHLKEWKQRCAEPWGDPVALYNGNVNLPIQGAWQITGQICIRQTDPLPIGISALISTIEVDNV